MVSLILLLPILTILSFFAVFPEPAHALWPQPRNLQTGPSTLRLSPSFTITVGVPNPPADLLAAAQRTRALLFNDKLGRLVLGRGTGDLKAVSSARVLSHLTLKLDGNVTTTTARPISVEAKLPFGQRDEGYRLIVPEDGSAAVLSANSTLGLFRGLTTFGQLWYTVSGTVYTLGAPVEIQDSPAYPYRGFMLDTARNYFPVSDIERTLDAMSWVHINTLHWHIVDSQSFPLVVPGFTDIAQKGAYSADAVYTPQDVANIVSYAGARGIDVLIEIDTPGHTSVISKAHPEHIACAEAKPWSTYANEPPAGQLRLASSATTNFTVGLLSAVAKLFPSPLFSTGGDEINARCYHDDAQTQNDLAGRSVEQALDVFTQATHGALKKLGKTPVVWEEMILNFNLTLSNDTIALVWISSSDAAAVASKGFRVIHAGSNSFYLDCGAGGWVGDFPAGNSWCEPYKTWQNAYTFDPLANLTTAQAPLVLGGQQLLWTEQSGPQNLDSIAWPRAAASAEVFWSGSGGNVSAALPRLHELGYRLRQRGVHAISLQPEWCALRPFACDLTA
ncbi:N-acetylhexosaminidase [Multifurca ochricompacta]|uniref:Beta-hexosaminidase n=1 Tax=Multifurca ochricompacta TaxID=376703 RepID=A0AAD4M192_9AGAM|nr:N-acetylhexosaminidase [Multifurca ochricompacta]